MNTLITIVGALFAIFSIILVHELGHFIAARLCGIKVLRFSIGFGFPLFKHVGKSGTEYVLAAFPLGGYVRMLGEHDVAASADSHLSFNAQRLWKRMCVVLAGPLINFILAVVAFWGVFMMGITHVKPVIGEVAPHSIAARAGLQAGDELLKVGGVRTPSWMRVTMALVTHLGDQGSLIVLAKSQDQAEPKSYRLDLMHSPVDQRDPDFLGSLGLTPYQPTIKPILAGVLPGSAAKRGGLRAGDRILVVAGTKARDWETVVKVVRLHPNKPLSLVVQRDGKRQKLSLVPQAKKEGAKTLGFLGAEVKLPDWPSEMMQETHYSVLGAGSAALQKTGALLALNVKIIAKMIVGTVSLQSLGGPITVFQAAGQASQAGLQAYLGFIAFISLSIGFLNLLPIPGLDGGHFLFQVMEAIFRRPVPQRYQTLGLSIGLVLLLFLMVQATVNDILRLL